MKISIGALLAALLVPASVLACGGLFCDAPPPDDEPGQPPMAVDQSSEIILFEVGEESLSATVSIEYTGDPAAFAWVVPVPSAPTLDVVPPDALRLLGTLTAPQVAVPQLTSTRVEFGRNCPPPPRSSSWGDDDDATPPSDDDDDATSGTEDPASAVTLEAQGNVGPYDFEVVSSPDPQALVGWLRDNGYLITPEMEPWVEQYVAEGMSFLGLQLAPEQGSEAIAPLRMTFPPGPPMVPLRLTAAASEPSLRLLVMVLGNANYAPANVEWETAWAQGIRMDPRSGFTNYEAKLAAFGDRDGGAFWVESAAPTGTSALRSVREGLEATAAGFPESPGAEWLLERWAEHDRFTRLVARLAPWQMTVDPVFEPQLLNAQLAVPTTSRPLWNNPGSHLPPGCGGAWCGSGWCGLTDNGQAGCACDAGSGARLIESPQFGGPGSSNQAWSTTCVPLDFDPMASMAAVECPAAACAGGDCVLRAGHPVCVCPELTVAIRGFGNPGITCAPLAERGQAQDLDWPGWPPDVPTRFVPCPDYSTVDEDGPRPAGCSLAGGASALVLLIPVLAWRRSRDRSAA